VNLDDLDQLIGGMTPGEWKASPQDHGGWAHVSVRGKVVAGALDADAPGIAALRSVAAELVAVARAATAPTGQDDPLLWRGELVCRLCGAWWRPPAEPVHADDCPLPALDAALARLPGPGES